MQAIADGLSWIIAKIVGFASWIGKLVVSCFVALWDVIKDAFSWLFEQCLEVAIAGIGLIDVSVVQQASSWWSAVPADVLNILGLIGFGEALALIFAAIMIRMTLQLIPFTRLGS